ncbi:MAG: alpha-hydroxy-acid oxidizing protein [Actinobacteria bacterium]|nr:alpha-hydroxy-acid oxidizing protein [Actinomycetota bacterium]
MSSERKFIILDDYEEAASKVIPEMAWDYYRSGSDDENTLKANRKAFEHYELWPRVLIDVSNVDLSATILGTKVSMPVLVAPTAYHKMAHPDGEVATAQGAAMAGTIMNVSTLATTSLEDVARASDGPKWFQLYVHSDRGLTKALIERAERSGYLAIVITVDAPVLGRRVIDERNSFALPEGMRMENIAAAVDDLESSSGSALANLVAARHDASFTWADLEWVRSITSLPIVIKGIVRPDDASLAVRNGASGLVVSNHGGRQLDGTVASIDALGPVRDSVEDSIAVLVDGGIRRGTDVLKALALGADAVQVGRPIIWGLSTGGTQGVAGVLELLRGELITAMKLSGCPDIKSIDASLVMRR